MAVYQTGARGHRVSRERGPGTVQADELYGKTQGGKLWIATAMSVATRLFVWAAVSPIRDSGLLLVVMEKVRAAARLGEPILFAVDGFSACHGYPEHLSRYHPFSP